MFRGGRGGNRRPHEKPRDGSHRGNRRSGGSKNEFKGGDKSEWVSYSRPKSSEVKPDEKKDVKPVKTENANQINQVEKPADSNGKSNSFQPKPEPSTDLATNQDSSLAGLRGKYQGKPGEKKFSGRCRLFVANMNNNTTEDELRNLFNEFGETGELFINKEKGFGFIRMDFRHNAELAKGALDKKVFKGRVIQVRFATHASAIELHGLDDFASNEYIENAMSQFGNVERAVVVCDDRGRSKGYAIVEFEWKKTAQKVLDRFKEEMFVLGRLPKPVFVKPRSQLDEEEGIHEEEIEKHPATKSERTFMPRFVSPSSFEYTWSKKWRDLFIEEEDKKAKLDRELQDARYHLEMEMETALRDQEAVKIRDGMIEELNRRQDELRRLEEDMRIRAEMNQRAREQLENTRPKPYDDRRSYSPRQGPPPRDELPPPPAPPIMEEGFPENPVRQNEIILQQQAELEMRRGELLRAAGMQPNMLGIRPELLQGPNMNLPQSIGGPLGMPPGPGANLPGPPMPNGPRGPPPPGMMPPQMHNNGPHPPRPHMPRDGPPPRRDYPPRGGDRFDHKRPRRD